MEQIRLLAAIGLSFLILFIWSVFFSHNPEIDKNITLSKEKLINNLDNNKKLHKNSSLQPKKISNPSQDHTYKPRNITIETNLFKIIISEHGGIIKNMILKNYKENTKPNSKLKEIISNQFSLGNIKTNFLSNKNEIIENTIFKFNSTDKYIKINNKKKSLNFICHYNNEIKIIKSFTFDPNSYLINVDLIIENISNDTFNDSIVLSLQSQMLNKASYTFEGPSAFIDNQLKQFKIKKTKIPEINTNKIKWIAIEDRYFMSGIIPMSKFNNIKIQNKNQIIENKITSEPFQLYNKEKINFNFSLFMGPKKLTILKNIGHNMEKVIYFGIFDFIAKPCLWFMNKIYSIIPNYGISIILLTIITKLLLWPLGSKGYKSMKKMKKIQPLIAEIRKKYGNDKQKMNQEMLGLYKIYNVNPMGGCLPMLLQIPVFFALYRMLYQAIELRHAPFILWINDLSAPDRLFNFNFSIPFMQPPFGIPILTIIMGGTMLLQQKMSPPPGDPTQAKIMMIMPIIFTFIFINFSSGLVLYWLTNNIFSISQQYYTQKKNT